MGEFGQKKNEMKLTKRLVIFYIVPITIILLISTLFSVRSVSYMTNIFLEHEVIHQAKMDSRRLDSYFEKYYMLLEEASHNAALENYFKTLTEGENYSINPYYSEIREILDSVINSAIEEEDRAIMWLADIDAQVVMEDSSSGMVMTLEENNWRCENRSWYAEAVESYDTFCAKVYVSAGVGEVVSSMITPIRDSDTGELLGVLGVDIAVEHLPELLGKTADDAGFFVVINSDGLILYHPDESQILDKCQNLDYYETIESQLWNTNQTICEFDVEGEKVLGVITRIDRAGWMMISAMPVQNMKDSIIDAIRPIIVICALNILIVVAMNYYFTTEHIIKPLKEIEKATESIANQNADYELKVKNQDEIGVIADVLNTDVKWLFKELKEKNQRINESMEYARIYQSRLFSKKEELDEIFAEYAVMYTPLEYVGGDFTWNYRGSQGSLFIMGDCTGHGVPGALLSGMVITMLTNIVNEENYTNLPCIVRELEQQLIRLSRSGTEGFEVGAATEMDIGMLYIANAGSMSYLGGNMDIYIQNGKEVQKIKGEKVHVGAGSLEAGMELPVHDVEYDKEYTYFIATDGFYEQTGGEKGIPYGYSRFKRVFGALHGQSTNDILNKLKMKWLKYKGVNRQRDDVTVVCFKVR